MIPISVEQSSRPASFIGAASVGESSLPNA
ncbi:hypothetical protein DSM3645_02503 [Blastopirellula marina DSM 3645]|uniref:Uncharacterized protein n=1 Tax=Blastopirellula marina DSM 3645 TaxID=314230 RepID=A3ZVG4_9BACT|nr:hypothetical protein DSM3645_02503 [Blastopirellula marina DSM 3645]